MIKTGVMQFGFAPVFYILKLVEKQKETYMMELNMGVKKTAIEYPNVF